MFKDRKQDRKVHLKGKTAVKKKKTKTTLFTTKEATTDKWM